MSPATRVAVAVLVVLGIIVAIARLDLPFPFTQQAKQITVEAQGNPPWTVEGFGWRYSVVSVARTRSEWQLKTRPSLTITAEVLRTQSTSSFAHMQYRVSDQGSGILLEEASFSSGGDGDPPTNLLSRLVHVVWDTEPQAKTLTIVLHDFYWPDGRDLILRNVPVPAR